MRILRVFGLLLVVSLVLLTTLPVHAALVTWQISATGVDSDNPLGLTNGSFSGSVTYNNEDPLLSPNGDCELFANFNHTDNTLWVRVGDMIFDQTDDMNYDDPNPDDPDPDFYFPRLIFSDGDLAGINFLVDQFSMDTFDNLTFMAYPDDSANPVFEIWDDNSLPGANGMLVSGTFSFTPVPVPPAVILLASGLIGMLGFKRRLLAQDGKH
jgi:hypothetical protein